jgi:hypothetical protein
MHEGGKRETGQAPGGPASFLLRPEHNEARFLLAHARELHGVVLLGRHLAPYSEGSAEAQEGLRGDELAQQVRAAQIPHFHDPDTAVLTTLSAHAAAAGAGRAGLMASARTLALPAHWEDLHDEELLRDLVVATLATQSGAEVSSAPYFRFDSLRDPWLAACLRAAAMTQELMRYAPIATFVQVGPQALREGVLAHAAGMYHDALAVRGPAFLQVAGFDAERAEPEDYLAFLNAVAAWRSRGFEVFADRVGRFGAAAVAAGAAGTASGTRVYRSVADLTRPSPSRSGAVRYWPPCRGDRLAVERARARTARGTIAPCPVDACDALGDGASRESVRWHNIHLSVHELALARNDPTAFARTLQASPIGYAREWGEALADALRLSAQA